VLAVSAARGSALAGECVACAVDHRRKWSREHVCGGGLDARMWARRRDTLGEFHGRTHALQAVLVEPATQRLEAEEQQERESDGEGEGDFDEELAAELDLALGSQGSSEGESDEEDAEEGERDAEGSGEDAEEDEEEDEDDEIDTAETKRARKLLNEEIRDLEAAVNKKSMEIERSLNPLIRRRFEEALRKLRTDLDLKIMQRSQLEEDHRMRKEAAAEEAAEQEARENVTTPDDASPGVGAAKPSISHAAVPNVDDDIMEEDDMADLFGADAPEVPVEVQPPQPPQPHVLGDPIVDDTMDIG